MNMCVPISALINVCFSMLYVIVTLGCYQYCSINGFATVFYGSGLVAEARLVKEACLVAEACLAAAAAMRALLISLGPRRLV